YDAPPSTRSPAHVRWRAPCTTWNGTSTQEESYHMLRSRPLIFFATVAIAFGACSSATPSGSPSATGGGPAASAPAETAAGPAIKEGGTLIAGLPGDMVLADPTLDSDSNSSYIIQNVVEGLVSLK